MTDDLKSEVIAILKEPTNKTNKDRLAQLYQAVFLLPLEIDCNKCITKAKGELQKWLDGTHTGNVEECCNEEKQIKNGITMSKVQYRIKESILPAGGVVQFKGGFGPYKHGEALSEKEVKALQKEHPNVIEEIPVEEKKKDTGK